MSYIHAAQLDALELTNWMNLLYGSVYAYFFVNNERIQIGAFYGLYLVWGTQPHDPKVPIPVSIVLWQSIKDLLTQQQVPVDVWAIYNQLRDQNAFNFTVLVEVLPPPLFWPSSENKIRPEVILADTLTGVIDESVLENIHQTYQQAKENSTDIPFLEFTSNLFTEEISQIISSNSRYSQDQQKIEQQKHLQFQEQIRLELQQKQLEQQQQIQQQYQQQQYHQQQQYQQQFSQEFYPDVYLQ